MNMNYYGESIPGITHKCLAEEDNVQIVVGIGLFRDNSATFVHGVITSHQKKHIDEQFPEIVMHF